MISTPHPPSGDQIEKNEMGGACNTCGGEVKLYRVLVEKPEGKGPIGRPILRWGIILRWIFRRWNMGL